MKQGGHHRLKAANDLGQETIRVNEIIPFEESVRLGIVDLPLGMIPNEF